MCYVLENFYSNYNYLRWHSESKSRFFSQNNFLTSVYFQKSWKKGGNAVKKKKKLDFTKLVFFKFYQNLFYNFILSLVHSQTILSSTIKNITSNYWTIRIISTNLMINSSSNFFVPISKARPFITHYYLFKPAPKTTIFKNPTFSYLNVNLVLWLGNFIPQHLKVFHLNSKTYLKVLPFYNQYFLKVYNF